MSISFYRTKHFSLLDENFQHRKKQQTKTNLLGIHFPANEKTLCTEKPKQQQVSILPLMT